MSMTKLLVPSGTPVQDSCGETFSPTQFGLVGAFAALLAAFFGIMVESLNVADVSEKISAAFAAVPTRPNASVAAAAANKGCRFTSMNSPPFFRLWQCPECNGRECEIKAVTDTTTPTPRKNSAVPK